MADGTPRHLKPSVNPGKKANSGNPVTRSQWEGELCPKAIKAIRILTDPALALIFTAPPLQRSPHIDTSPRQSPSAHERGEPEVAKLLNATSASRNLSQSPLCLCMAPPNFTTQYSGSIAGENSP